mgnify:CR=1 FL=1
MIKAFTPNKSFNNISKKELNNIISDKLKRGILKRGNKKLGKLIWDFSLPPVESCPDCEDCKLTCYAVRYYNQYKQSKKCYNDNFKLCLNDLKTFKKLVLNQLKNNNIHNVRIHASGDFYNMEYLKAWIDIVKKCKNIKFFAYSKAFTNIPNLPANLNIINSFVTIDNVNYLNYGTYESIAKMRGKIKGIICPVTIGKNIDCSTCKYCITKNKVLFVQH